MKKDWMIEDNSAEFAKSRESRQRRRESGMINELIGQSVIRNHPQKEVGAVVKKFKRNATPEQLEALKNVKAANQDRPYL